MNRKKLCVIVPVCLILAACAPIGGIGGASASSPGYESFWIVPYHQEYGLNTLFLRDSDLGVFCLYDGAVVKIPNSGVDISVIENPDTSSEATPVPADSDFRFTSAGRKIIKVKYQTMSDNYTVQVKEPGETPNPGGNNGGGGSGIIIEWGS